MASEQTQTEIMTPPDSSYYTIRFDTSISVQTPSPVTLLKPVATDLIASTEYGIVLTSIFGDTVMIDHYKPEPVQIAPERIYTAFDSIAPSDSPYLNTNVSQGFVPVYPDLNRPKSNTSDLSDVCTSGLLAVVIMVCVVYVSLFHRVWGNFGRELKVALRG